MRKLSMSKVVLLGVAIVAAAFMAVQSFAAGGIGSGGTPASGQFRVALNGTPLPSVSQYEVKGATGLLGGKQYTLKITRSVTDDALITAFSSGQSFATATVSLFTADGVIVSTLTLGGVTVSSVTRAGDASSAGPALEDVVFNARSLTAG
jgi:hypothetical protein